jgi:uncharacterized protein (TIGR00375 family)
MKFIADFHIHSKYSRATARNMDLENIDKWAKIKGIKVVGTGDFTHPQWLDCLKKELEPAEAGLFKLRKNKSETRFILTAEISCIYSKKEKVRKIHILIFAPCFKTVEKINDQLNRIGNLKSDGRPILGLDAKELAKIALNVSSDCLIVPAHLMTPWFSLFGSRSGFDSLRECFEEYSQYIYAGETGLSADPEMLWQMPDGRKLTLISNSDAHSPAKLGREANVFDTEINYQSIIKAIKEKDAKKFLYTIEFYPEQGKYHFDGHRSCDIVFSPEQSKKYNNLCPVCGKKLTIGVLNRVKELADKSGKTKPKNVIPFKSLVPLEEIIADSLGQNVGTKAVIKRYNELIDRIGPEFNVLLEATEKELEQAGSSEIAQAIIKVRQGKVFRQPGYDGVFGKIKTSPLNQSKKLIKQNVLF